MLAALAALGLCVSSILTTGRPGVVAASALFVAAAVIEEGLAAAAAVYAVSAVLGAVLAPEKTPVVLYAIFLGYYPIVKSLAERLRAAAVRWAVKLAAANAAMAVLWFALRGALLGAMGSVNLNAALLFAAGNAVFVLYDVGMSKLINLYVSRVRARR
jgi:hypothetical protein